MQRLFAILIPIAIAIAVSVWLYGFPGKHQRLVASPRRRRIALGAAVVTAFVLTVAFFTRASWTPSLGAESALRLFLGGVLLLVALLYALLPPQRAL
jgi:hypothetical protein